MCTHDGFAYAGKITDRLSLSKLFKANFLPDLTPFGISANDDQILWGTYGIDSVTSEPVYYFMSLTNDGTLSAATPICLYQYNHDSTNTGGSFFTPKMVSIDPYNDYFMVGEDRGGLGQVLVFKTGYSSSLTQCNSQARYIMLE